MFDTLSSTGVKWRTLWSWISIGIQRYVPSDSCASIRRIERYLLLLVRIKIRAKLDIRFLKANDLVRNCRTWWWRYEWQYKIPSRLWRRIKHHTQRKGEKWYVGSYFSILMPWNCRMPMAKEVMLDKISIQARNKYGDDGSPWRRPHFCLKTGVAPALILPHS